jgi:hypothetical protein
MKRRVFDIDIFAISHSDCDGADYCDVSMVFEFCQSRQGRPIRRCRVEFDLRIPVRAT